jgi:CRISPR-associated endonuclease/helicase Cas3
MLPELTQPDRLLAKSFDGSWKGSYSLVGYTADVVNAVTTLVDILGSRLLTQFSLSCDLAALRATVRLAAYLHDWGKANDHFQEMMRGKRNPREQMVRHEAISVLLALEFRDWLEQDRNTFLTAVAAAGGHHLKLGGKAGKKTDDFFEDRPSGADHIHLYLKPKYFKDLLVYRVYEATITLAGRDNYKSCPHGNCRLGLRQLKH